MEPKEKAYKLIERFYEIIAVDNRSYNFDSAINLHLKSPIKTINRAKECALISVGEILISIEINVKKLRYDGTEPTNLMAQDYEYWKLVKYEIEKI